MGQILGIDLGSTNSKMAILEEGVPRVIPNAEGNLITPSVVAFKGGSIFVGQSAKDQAVLNPERTIMHVKRKMGTNYKVTIDDKTYTPQEISAFILTKIKVDAEAYLGEELKKAVITVPAYFNEKQRQATIDAGTKAGLDVLKTISDPTAAGIAYCLNKNVDQKIIILNLGGGHFGITIMKTHMGVLEVLSTSGDTQLGGMNIDDKIIKCMISEFKKKEGIDISDNRVAFQRLMDAAERAKIELSSVLTTTINLPFITSDSSAPKHLEMELTRSKLGELVEPVLARCEGPISRAFKDAKLDFKDINEIILVGGPTRMPIVRETFEKIIGKKTGRGVDPMQCVAMGAAIQGGMLANDNTVQ